jgi:hypothetical protein
MSLLDSLLKEGRIYTTLCQHPKCHAILGGMHVPCAGGVAVFICHQCGTVSTFKNGTYGIVPGTLGTIPLNKLRAHAAGEKDPE